jgi:hypothetical protein
MRSSSGRHSTLSYRRIKRIDIRRKAKYYGYVWNRDESEAENNNPEDIMNNFLKVKNYLQGLEKSHIVDNDNQSDSFSLNSNDESDHESENDNPMALISVDDRLKLLSKKTQRECEGVPEGDKQENEENKLAETIELDDQSFGPQPIIVELDKKEEKKFYAGTSINKDEAQKYAHYVQQGKRIPRRGEVGLTSQEIDKYESLGYVMSGVRHKKMTMARLKKEQQVYTAEEKRALAIYNLEEQLRKERNIINEMKKWRNDTDEIPYDKPK